MNWVTMSGIGILVYSILAGILKRLPFQRPFIHLFISIAAVLLIFIPFRSYSLATILYGATAELSVTAVILLILALARRKLGRSWLSAQEKMLLAAIVIVLGLLLYPGVLGFRYFDFYADGYWGGLFGFFMIAVTLFFAVFRMWKLAAMFGLAWIAWRLCLGNSTNLWDYVLDIWVFIWGLGVWVHYGLQRLRYRGAYPSPDSP